MKKVRDFAILSFALLITLQLIVTSLKNFHEVDYIITKDNEEFNINEKFYKENKVNYYEVKVSHKEDVFLFTTDSNINKQKNVVEDIYFYNKANVKCIAIKLQKEELINYEPVCKYNDQLYSYSQLENELEDKITFKKDLYKKAVINTNFINDSFIKTESDIDFLENNIPDNMFVGIWKYRGLLLKGDNRTRNLGLVGNDVYENDMSTLINEYFIIPSYSHDFESNSYVRVNVTTGSIDELEFKTKLNNNSFTQGVHHNKLYVFDNSNLKQYTIDPIAKKIEEIGNEDNGVVFYDKDKFVNKTVHEIKNKNEKFNLLYNKDLENYKYSKLNETNNSYYILSNNKIYKIYKNHLNNPILIYENKDIKDYKFSNNYISFIIDNKLYFYNEKYGLKQIAIYNEFKYNDNDFHFVYVKP